MRKNTNVHAILYGVKTRLNILENELVYMYNCISKHF